MTDTASDQLHQVNLTGRVVIVTGASRGIGKGLALGLAQSGATVVCAARTVDTHPDGLPGTIHETVARIEEGGGTALAVRCDIGAADDIQHLADTTIDTYGRIDVLVNNAMAPTRSAFAASTVEQWDESMRVNVRSLYLFCQAVVPHMTASGGGSIINISSGGAGHESTPFMPPGYVIYAVAKAAMERFSTALAPELQDLGIAINALRPGAVKTELSVFELGEDHDWTGWKTPDAVVPAVAYLSAPENWGFTGRVLDSTQFGTVWP
jgi:NAD(P)-dependent dehydrogenase (short-subunit alcohol dehydrogenase family)